MYVTAIVLAAGKGYRLQSRIPKPLIEINSKPIIVYSLNILSRHPKIKEIILVANPKNLKDTISKIRQYRIKKIKHVVLGGRMRQDSVINGLRAVSPKTDLVLIHDGARPFINKKMVSKVIKETERYGAAVVGVPANATIKQVIRLSGYPVTRKLVVEKTLNRDNLWEIQTPQVFRKALILKAYKKFGNLSVTDDSMLVEKLGAKVSVVSGSYNNIKITTPEDLVIAEAIAKKWNTE